MNKRLYPFFLFAILISIYLIERHGMFMDVATFARESTITTIIAFILTLSFLAIILSQKPVRSERISKRFFYLQLFIYIISFFYFILYPAIARNTYGLILLPLLLFYFGRNTSQYAKSENMIIWSISIVFVLLSYYFLTNINREVFLFEEEYVTSASYSILYLLPFMLCHKKNYLRFLSIILALIVVMLSLKRGGFLALILATFVYIVIYQIGTKGKSHPFFRIMLSITFLSAIYVLINYLNEDVIYARLTQRFESDETGGSGRIDIFRTYWNIIINSSLWHLLIGQGWCGSIRVSGIGVTCHNDFLESIIDFGIVGFILYILLYIELIRYCWKMIKNNNPFAPAMGASIAIFFVNSMVSHILIYPKYLMLFTLFWGFIVSVTKRDNVKRYNI